MSATDAALPGLSSSTQRLRVFVSTTIGELAPERGAAAEAIASLLLAPVLFELGTRASSPRTMYRALSRRDAAYEGVFFTGVKTTGIFCRPTCKAKRPRAENVEFFPTVNEALHGGYRPCRLCRPMDGAKPVPPLVV